MHKLFVFKIELTLLFANEKWTLECNEFAVAQFL